MEKVSSEINWPDWEASYIFFKRHKKHFMSPDQYVYHVLMN